MVYVDPTIMQQVFDVPKRERETYNTARRMISGDVLKYRKGLRLDIRRG